MERKSISITSLFEVFLIVVLAIVTADMVRGYIHRKRRQNALTNLSNASNQTTQAATTATTM